MKDIFAKRHYEFIAATIRNMPDQNSRLEAAHEFSTALARLNRNFDIVKFVRAAVHEDDVLPPIAK